MGRHKMQHNEILSKALLFSVMTSWLQFLFYLSRLFRFTGKLVPFSWNEFPVWRGTDHLIIIIIEGISWEMKFPIGEKMASKSHNMVMSDNYKRKKKRRARDRKFIMTTETCLSINPQWYFFLFVSLVRVSRVLFLIQIH